MATLWSLLIVDPLIILSTLVCGAVSGAIALFGPSTRSKQIAMSRAWARSILFFAGVKVEVEGLERLAAAGPYVFTANHLSYMDTPVILTNIPVQFRFLAKKGLFQIPFLGWHLKTAGHVPVPREDPRAAVRTLSLTAKLIESDGTSVLFFPEGGRSADGTLQDFKDGAAYIAIKAQAPLVPVALLGSHRIMPMGSMTIRGGRVKLRIGEPIPTKGMTLKDRGTLSEAAREQVTRMLGEQAPA
jgi:1-acyl-sn-glycerol-3-phosphate acyltransferase